MPTNTVTHIHRRDMYRETDSGNNNVRLPPNGFRLPVSRIVENNVAILGIAPVLSVCVCVSGRRDRELMQPRLQA